VNLLAPDEPQQPIAYDPSRNDPPPLLDVHHAALQEIDRVVGNQLTLDVEDTTRLRGILFAALAAHATPPGQERHQ